MRCRIRADMAWSRCVDSCGYARCLSVSLELLEGLNQPCPRRLQGREHGLALCRVLSFEGHDPKLVDPQGVDQAGLGVDHERKGGGVSGSASP